jgi:hypothetical protein
MRGATHEGKPMAEASDGEVAALEGDGALRILSSRRGTRVMARLTFLIDEAEKDAFARVCASQDLTSSQMLRRLVDAYLRAGLPPASVGE